MSGLLSRLLPLLPAQPFDYTLVSRDPQVIQAMEEDPLYYKGKMRARTGYQQLLGIREVLLRSVAPPAPAAAAARRRRTAPSHPRPRRRIFQAASSPDKTLKIFPGLWHEILNEPERQQVLEMILDWLRRHLG